MTGIMSQTNIIGMGSTHALSRRSFSPSQTGLMCRKSMSNAISATAKMQYHRATSYPASRIVARRGGTERRDQVPSPAPSSIILSVSATVYCTHVIHGTNIGIEKALCVWEVEQPQRWALYRALLLVAGPRLNNYLLIIKKKETEPAEHTQGLTFESSGSCMRNGARGHEGRSDIVCYCENRNLR